MQRYARTDRVAHLVHRELSEIIEREMKDERLGGMITITGVNITKDMKFAKVYFSVLGDEKTIKITQDTLNSASQYIRSRLNERISLKNIPSLTFYYDSSMATGMRIGKLLNEIKKHDES